MERGSILIVDDSDVIRTALDQILRARGYAVLTAMNGHDALKAAGAVASDSVFVDLSRSARDRRDSARIPEAWRITAPLIGIRSHPKRRCAPQTLSLPPRSGAPVAPVFS